jgi:predicted secreted protein
MNYETFRTIGATAIVAAIVTIGIFALGAPPASAQSIIATVPFTFSADDQTFPAGTYQFTSLSGWSLSIRDVKSGGEKFFAVQPTQDGSRASRDGIIFHSSKGQKSLEAVYLRESNLGAELLTHAGSSPKPRPPFQNATLR